MTMDARISRRLLGLGLASTALARPALAQPAWPQRPVRWVVPFAPGGNIDVMARLFAEPLSRELGQPVVVENRAGASGSVGADFVAKSAPDGYTILMGSVVNVINMGLYRNLTFDFAKDLAPVAMLYSVPSILLVRPDFPARSVAELVALAKRQPGVLNYGSAGSGSGMHLSTVLFAQSAGIELTHVPYRGAAQAQQDMLGGRIQMIFDNMSTALPMVRDGQARALGVTAASRVPQLPDVPTMAEAGVPVDLQVWGGAFAPSGTPAAILDRLASAFLKVGTMPALAERLRSLGSTSSVGERSDFTRFVASESLRLVELVKLSGASVD
ncbi:Bug family tripartite tricarboxylate transporter substrate binding protein [Falsiroseomonas sp.]|uniref:Bug family tripartite tricarboxylate transporter substrate binding protein n=1 Tax=Falsiroseomonas sp. TaxID=2870721 RepID=UPI003F707AE6